MLDDYLTPDGVFRIEFQSFEMRMSHWVCNPRVIHRPSGEILLDCFDTMDDGQPSVDDQGRLHLSMRTYPGTQPGTEIIYDPREGTVTHVDGGKSETSFHNVLIKYVTRPHRPEPPAPAPTECASPSAPAPTPPMRLCESGARTMSETPEHRDAQGRPAPRWRAYVYPFIFYASLPAVTLAAILGARTTPFKRLPWVVAAGLLETLIIAGLLVAGFLFMLWLHRGKRV
jgi:hypothetical protein